MKQKRNDPDIVRLLRSEEQQGQLKSAQKGSSHSTKAQTKQSSSLFQGIKDLENLYRTVFENSAVAITITDEKERIISWNKYTEQLLHWSHDDLFLQPIKSLYPEDAWKKIRGEDIRQKGMQHHLETQMLTKENSVLDVDLSLSVLRNHSGDIIGSIGVIRDISERKKVEQALAQSERTFKQLYEHAPVPYHTLSPDGTITNVNEKWCEILGYARSEVVGKKIFTFVESEQQLDAKLSFEKKISQRKSYHSGHERVYLTKDGKSRVFAIHDYFSKDGHGSVVSIHTIMEDVTKRKQLEERLRKARDELEERVKIRTAELLQTNEKLQREIGNRLRAEVKLKEILQELKDSKKKIEEQNKRLRQLDDIRSTFLNVTSHELRTPMSAIKGYIQMTLRETLGPTTEDQHKALGVVLRNTNRLDHLIQDILDISRLESGTMKFIPETCNLEQLIKETREIMQSHADEKQIIIKTKIDTELPETVVDSERITQVIINLLNNAIKFSPKESTIWIRAYQKADEIVVEVQDHGKGIPKKKLRRVFETFFQVDSTRDIKFGGAGLGLSICRGIILAHGGQIWVESEVGRGSTFHFTLPIKPVIDMEGRFKEVDIFQIEDKKNLNENKEERNDKNNGSR